MASSTYEQWLSRGRAHQRDARAIDAMLCYRRAMRLDPKAVEAPFHLGEVEWQLGRAAEATAAWREALRRRPDTLAAAQALAEALLAAGDPAGAAEVADRVMRLSPEDLRARFIAAVAALWTGSEDSERRLTEIGDLLLRDAGLGAIPTLAAPLALALDRSPRSEARSALLFQLANIASTGALAAQMPALLVALACERVAEPGDSPNARGQLFAAALARDYAIADHEALRRIARAAASAAPDAANEIAQRYASLCAKSFAPPYPLVWPLRTSGTRVRVVALVASTPNEQAAAALDLIATLPRKDFDVSIAVVGGNALPDSVGGNESVRMLGRIGLPPLPDLSDAQRVAALDADALIDLCGLDAAAGPLLARRPARSIVTPLDLAAANVAPLVDRADVRASELPRALAAARAALGNDAVSRDAQSMAAMWQDAVRAHERHDLGTARERYAAVVELQPDHAPAHYLIGIVLRDSGDADAARRELGNAVAIAPRFVDARAAAARAAQAAGDARAAAALCMEGLPAASEPLPLLRALGQARLALRDGAGAAEAFARALAIDPIDAETHYNRGVALQMLRRADDAAREYQHALAFKPGLTAAEFNLGTLLRERGAVDGAVFAYDSVIRAEPANAAAHRSLCEVLYGAGRVDAWLEAFGRFESNCPDALGLAVQALEACQHRGDFAAIDRYLDGLRAERFAASDPLELCDNLEQLLYLLLFFDVEPEVVFRFARTYDAALRHVHGAPLVPPTKRRPGRIRIGYVGADLRNHVMGKMIWQAIEHHDRSRFALHFYALSSERDEWTERFAAFGDHFEGLAGLYERDAAERIAAADLDVLVDLSTNTHGAKPGILALKPARVQITHVASAGSIGLSTVDFKLTDHRADVAEAQAYQIETLLPMEGCVYPYRHIGVAAAHPFRRRAFGIPADAVVIGAFVAPLKLSRRCLSLWREVLERIPRARLAFSPTHAAFGASYARIAAAAGIAADRLIFLPQGANDAENQGRYELVDFVLDPMPFGGVNGTLEALDMGVPVVTLVGKRHGERSSFSILASLGVTETVAATGREYVELAVRLADDRSFMREVRAAIRAGLAGSELTDMPRHTRNLEDAYVNALRQKAPDALRDAEG